MINPDRRAEGRTASSLEGDVWTSQAGGEEGATEERFKMLMGEKEREKKREKEGERERESQTYVTSSALRPLKEEIKERWRDDDERVKA